jgi:antitoxin component YwqK of YwqJK toxin-antitoxin module
VWDFQHPHGQWVAFDENEKLETKIKITNGKKQI